MSFFKKDIKIKFLFTILLLVSVFSFAEKAFAAISYTRDSNGYLTIHSDGTNGGNAVFGDLVLAISQNANGLNRDNLQAVPGPDAAGNRSVRVYDPRGLYEPIFRSLEASTWDRLVIFTRGLTTFNTDSYTAVGSAYRYGMPLETSELTIGEGVCVNLSITDFAFHPLNCIAQILYFVLWLVSFIVAWIGALFDFVFNVTVRNISKTLGDFKVINAAWTVVRDLCNIFFIFILLWLGISTILGLDEHGVKHSLSRLIVAAVLINFSLLFTKVVIDVPNMISVTIYEQITGGYVSQGGPLSNKGLGSAVFSILRPEEVGAVLSSGPTADLRSAASDPRANEDAAQAFASKGFGTSLTTFVMMIIVYATVLFVFLAVCIIFIKRFIILIFLMIFSPLAFLGMAVPIHSLQHEAQHRFWNTLFKESFYAPIFLLCFYVTIQMGNVIYNSLQHDITGTIFGFTVVIVMMVASLIIAESMGVSGAGGAMTAFKGMSSGAANWASAHTVGRVASTLINKTGRGDKLRDMAAGKFGNNLFTRTLSTAFGRAVVGASDKLGASFDEKVKKDNEWREAAIQNRHGDHQFKADLISKSASDSMVSADRKGADSLWDHDTLENKANMYMLWKDMARRTAGDVVDKFDDHGHKIGTREISQQEIDNAKDSIYRYIGDKTMTNSKGEHGDGHGRLQADEVTELQRVVAKGLTYHDNKFRHSVEAGNADEVSRFLATSTEGQALSAIKALGAAGDNFSTAPANAAMRASLIQGLKRFKGEAFLASFAKDDSLSESVKSAGSDSGYDTKVTWDLSEALTEPTNRTTALVTKFQDKLTALNDPRLTAAIASGNVDTMITEYQAVRSGDEVTRNYMDSTNGQRSQVKTEAAMRELNDLMNNHEPQMKYGKVGNKKYVRQ